MSKMMRLHQIEMLQMLSVTLSDAEITLVEIAQHVQLVSKIPLLQQSTPVLGYNQLYPMLLAS